MKIQEAVCIFCGAWGTTKDFHHIKGCGFIEQDILKRLKNIEKLLSKISKK